MQQKLHMSGIFLKTTVKINMTEIDEQSQGNNSRWRSTLEQPGVKAPGTANKTPVFPLNSSAMFTFSPGEFS